MPPKKGLKRKRGVPTTEQQPSSTEEPSSTEQQPSSTEQQPSSTEQQPSSTLIPVLEPVEEENEEEESEIEENEEEEKEEEKEEGEESSSDVGSRSLGGESSDEDEIAVENEPENAMEIDEETKAIPPLSMYFPPSEYVKKIKLSTRCYIHEVLTIFDKLEPPMSKSERAFFENHPSFQHVFHMPRDPNHRVMGMWMLLLRTTPFRMLGCKENPKSNVRNDWRRCYVRRAIWEKISTF